MPAPPSKRLRGEESAGDGFGDDFTQEDLDMIDVFTTQANHSPAERGDHLTLLTEQHTDLREKLKEVEERVVLKEGEIRLLRDSLRGVQQEKEVQKEQRLLLEQQRHKEQQEKEKELLKKIQSLQVELHFKEAELITTRSRLVSSSSPLPRNSPRVLGSSPQVHHGMSSPSPTGNSFITKETFGAQLSPKSHPRVANGTALPRNTPALGRPDGTTLPRNSPALGRPDGTTLPRNSPALGRPDGLLSLLLQPHLSPSSLSLCHLLMGRHHRPQQEVLEENPDSFRLLQNLAMTGLLMLTPQPGTPRTRTTTRWCSGAVHLLPLLHHHLTELCDSLGSRGAGGVTEEAGRGGEERGLATLRVLQLLLAHSDEVVESLLQPETRVVTEQTRPGPGAGPGVLVLVLQLCDPGFCSPAEQTDRLVHAALRSLRILLERSPHTHRVQGVCWQQAVCVCVSAGSSLPVLQECVSLLRWLAERKLLDTQLCSMHESCVFLRLFEYITTRIEPLTLDWTLLDLQVIRLLSRLLTDSTWSSNTHNCPCYTQVVQTVVVLLHRHWLELRDRRTALPGLPGGSQVVLREALLLLHGRLAEPAACSLSPALSLHLQVLPALRDDLRAGDPPLSYSQELALEEVCRSEADDSDLRDTEGS